MNTFVNNQPTQHLPERQTEALQPAKSAPLQPAIVIAAEIAFAAVLLYMTNQPIETTPELMANNKPLITITIPANVAIASTSVADTAVASASVANIDPMIESAIIQTSH